MEDPARNVTYIFICSYIQQILNKSSVAVKNVINISYIHLKNNDYLKTDLDDVTSLVQVTSQYKHGVIHFSFINFIQHST